jgi:DNA-binding GntR family transcriptional regulator
LRRPTRLRLVDDAYRSLEDAILAGRLAPGERLVEPHLAEQLGVSRTTVREALLMLQRQGLIDSEPRRGTFVARLSREDAADLCQSRALIESYAVTVGYDNIDADALGRLEALLTQMGACRLPDEIPQLLRLDLDFHRTLVESAHSPRLLDLWSNLNGQIRALYIGTLERRQAGIEEVISAHRQLLDTVATGGRAAAMEAVIEHYIWPEDYDGWPGELLATAIGATAQRKLDPVLTSPL